MTKIIIAGCRTFNNYELLVQACDNILANTKDIEIVSGNAKGADYLGEQYAKEKNYKLTLFPANWHENKKAAGPLRNTEMALYADNLILFWDYKSRGSYDMFKKANRYNVETRIVNIYTGEITNTKEEG